MNWTAYRQVSVDMKMGEAMKINRRHFLGAAGTMVGGTLGLRLEKTQAARKPRAPSDPYGCLMDLTFCVGCRKCELACNQVHGLPLPQDAFDDPRTLERKRRPNISSYTVVNRYYTGKLDERNQLIPTFVKIQCMHCQDPACVSACIVGALTKKSNGAVHYDASKCMGCRYCMVACPFQIPFYDYHDPFTPQVRKSTFCYDRIIKRGGKPACAAICPVEAISFGKRRQIIQVARQRIKNDPGRYLNRIYGEYEVGGTSWLYISGEPFENLGFLSLPSQPIPHLTETIQHGLFKYLWAPLSLFAVLGGFMWTFNRKQIASVSEPDREGESI